MVSFFLSHRLILFRNRKPTEHKQKTKQEKGKGLTMRRAKKKKAMIPKKQNRERSGIYSVCGLRCDVGNIAVDSKS
jgi:hypothetical protein